MSESFAVSMCRGPFSNLDEGVLARAISSLVFEFSLDTFGDYCLHYGRGEEALESAAEDLGEETTFNNRELWIKTVQWYIARELYRAAKEIYLKRRSDVAYTYIHHEPWIISGGMADLDYPDDVCEKIDLISWAGLDKALWRAGY